MQLRLVNEALYPTWHTRWVCHRRDERLLQDSLIIELFLLKDAFVVVNLQAYDVEIVIRLLQIPVAVISDLAQSTVPVLILIPTGNRLEVQSLVMRPRLPSPVQLSVNVF